MGWNNIKTLKNSSLFNNIINEKGFYFLHSFYFSCFNPDDTLASAFYSKEFSCVVNLENIYGVQFHPEKSHDNGVALFRNFAEL